MKPMISFYEDKDPIPSFLDGNGDRLYLLAGESHGSDDYACASVWSHYDPDKHLLSKNIVVVAMTVGLNGAALLVKKVDPSIPEVITFGSPETGDVTITF